MDSISIRAIKIAAFGGALTAFTSISAQATGGFACTASGAGVEIAIGGSTSSEPGAKVVHAGGNITVKDGPDVQVDLASIAQYWNDARSFRMFVTVQISTSETLALSINASGRGNRLYTGTYSLAGAKVQRTGRITCDARG